MFDNKGNLIRNEKCELILFQGDSITDMNRTRDNDVTLGSCYPMYISSAAVIDGGKKVQCMNRAISGDRVVDLLARWKKDCLNLKPDIVSILIGVNDMWHEFDFGNGVDAQEFEEVYDLLLNLTERKNPGTRFVIMEPFLLPGHATNTKWDQMMPEVRLRAEAARRVAEKHNAIFVPLQNMLAEACDKYGAGEVALDGVHPNALGHQLIAKAWMHAVWPENF